MNHVQVCLQKYFVFSGRASRSEYWSFVAFTFLVNLLCVVLAAVINPMFETVGLVFAALTLIPGITVMVRRLHDTNRSGWWFFINLIPLIGFIWFVILLLLGSKNENNKY